MIDNSFFLHNENHMCELNDSWMTGSLPLYIRQQMVNEYCKGNEIQIAKYKKSSLKKEGKGKKFNDKWEKRMLCKDAKRMRRNLLFCRS